MKVEEHQINRATDAAYQRGYEAGRASVSGSVTDSAALAHRIALAIIKKHPAVNVNSDALLTTIISALPSGANNIEKERETP